MILLCRGTIFEVSRTAPCVQRRHACMHVCLRPFDQFERLGSRVECTHVRSLRFVHPQEE